MTSHSECIKDYVDKRELFRETLVKRFNMPLVVIKVNYPGTNKSNDITNNIIENLDEIVSDIFSPFIFFKILRITEDGPVLILVINEDATEIKKTTIEIEDKHILGTCVNIDVYDKNTKKISRKDLGHDLRKCCICGNEVKQCIEEKKHSQDQVIQYIVGKYREYMESFYGKKI